jgi:hypothetical protein
MKSHPGCAEFARRTTHMLNVDLRPATAKWHRALNEGRLKSRDGANPGLNANGTSFAGIGRPRSDTALHSVEAVASSYFD